MSQRLENGVLQDIGRNGLHNVATSQPHTDNIRADNTQQKCEVLLKKQVKVFLRSASISANGSISIRHESISNLLFSKELHTRIPAPFDIVEGTFPLDNQIPGPKCYS